jgi:N-acetyl-gamma-glutamylphosphate reductase
MMKNVLITGATGNVGLEVIKSLGKLPHGLSIYVGVRDVVKDGEILAKFEGKPTHFDFTDASTYQALSDCDILFLLRPPQISDTKQYFKLNLRKLIE